MKKEHLLKEAAELGFIEILKKNTFDMFTAKELEKIAKDNNHPELLDYIKNNITAADTFNKLNLDKKILEGIPKNMFDFIFQMGFGMMGKIKANHDVSDSDSDSD